MNVQIWTMNQDAAGLSMESWEGKGSDETDVSDSETVVPERKQAFARKTLQQQKPTHTQSHRPWLVALSGIHMKKWYYNGLTQRGGWGEEKLLREQKLLIK